MIYLDGTTRPGPPKKSERLAYETVKTQALTMLANGLPDHQIAESIGLDRASWPRFKRRVLGDANDPELAAEVRQDQIIRLNLLFETTYHHVLDSMRQGFPPDEKLLGCIVKLSREICLIAGADLTPSPGVKAKTGTLYDQARGGFSTDSELPPVNSAERMKRLDEMNGRYQSAGHTDRYGAARDIAEYWATEEATTAKPMTSLDALDPGPDEEEDDRPPGKWIDGRFRPYRNGWSTSFEIDPDYYEDDLTGLS